jgi:hypothetical protein
MEIWKSIPTHPNYEASSLGRVRHISGYVLSARADGKYLRVNLNQRKRKVHQLVLEAFVGARLEGQVCRHLNGVGTDNRLENLLWGSQQENSQDAFLHGTGPHKLAPIHVGEIRRLHGEGLRVGVLAKRFGVRVDTINWHLRLGRYA